MRGWLVFYSSGYVVQPPRYGQTPLFPLVSPSLHSDSSQRACYGQGACLLPTGVQELYWSQLTFVLKSLAGGCARIGSFTWLSFTHTHTHADTHPHVRTHTFTYIDTHTHTPAHMHAPTHTYKHTRTHTHLHLHTHAHTHTWQRGVAHCQVAGPRTWGAVPFFRRAISHWDPKGPRSPSEPLRMEVIYCWPLCLFSLPPPLVQLSTLLSYLAAQELPECVCLLVAVCVCV